MKDATFSPGQGSFRAYMWLLVVTGVALVFSMPSATFVRELLASPLRRPTPIVFFATYVFAFAMFGLNRGAAGVPHRIAGLREVRTAVLQVLFGQLILSPYLVYVRIILLPSRQPAIALIALYALLVGLFCAIVGYAVELWGTARGFHTTVHRYALGTLVLGAPLLFLVPNSPAAGAAILSPLGAFPRLLDGVGWVESMAIFLIPAVASLLVLLATGIVLARYRHGPS